LLDEPIKNQTANFVGNAAFAAFFELARRLARRPVAPDRVE
jgi:hypothetical protein